MVEFHHVNKSYDGEPAVKDISFTVEKGELFGLIGPDGAGKSTLFRILTTVLLADSGTVLFDGHDVVEDYKYVRRNVGYMPGRFSLYQDLSVRENLEFFATIFNTTIQENYDLIKDIYEQLEPFENRRAGDLSGGMKQKLALSCALIHKPKVLVLDEPTFGVDAVSRKEFWDMLKTLKEKGVTILVSTPYMDEAELCDRVALIQKGDILEIDTPEGIIKRFDKKLYKLRTPEIYPALTALSKMEGMELSFSFGQEIHIYSKEEIDERWLEAQMKEQGINNVEVSKGQPGIEDCFMDLMVSGNLLEEVGNE
ncbi:MAG: ABC transporter ATP-binding protein [Bacteroidetes bacterium]|nr:MAG: ABC transporter ATP-binding protein [Bacteroidota bacterium]